MQRADVDGRHHVLSEDEHEKGVAIIKAGDFELDIFLNQNGSVGISVSRMTQAGMKTVNVFVNKKMEVSSG